MTPQNKNQWFGGLHRGTKGSISIVLIGLLFVAAGLNHFWHPNFYLRMMPPYLPWHLELIWISGGFEILGGLALFWTRLRQIAGYGLLALLVAVSPVHIHMIQNYEQYADIPFWVLVVRLPMQILLMIWVYVATCRPVRTN